MFKKIRNIFYLLSFFIFLFLISNFYFSDKNISKTNKLRMFYLNHQEKDLFSLPFLKNDTNNIIEYKNDLENYKKNKKKYIFWDLISK